MLFSLLRSSSDDDRGRNERKMTDGSMAVVRLARVSATATAMAMKPKRGFVPFHPVITR